jgi:hypothetical protein
MSTLPERIAEAPALRDASIRRAPVPALTESLEINKETTMTDRTKKLIRPSRYIMLSAGFLLQAQRLFAAEPGDTDALVRAFLNPPAVSNVRSADSVAAGYLDAGERVRAFILGNANVAGAVLPAVATAASSVHGGNRGDTDAQETVRRMILGIGTPVIASINLTVSEL